MAQTASMPTQSSHLRGGGAVQSYISSPDTTSSIPDAISTAPDQKSPIYPKRAIRPLPKRTLRSRLSEEAAEAIAYPPILPSTSLPIYNQYGEDGGYLNENKVHVHPNGEEFDDVEHEHHHHDHDHYHDEEDCPHHHCDHDHDHDDEDDIDSADDIGPTVVRRGEFRSSPRSPRLPRAHRYTVRSSPSAPDGYDAFENTNNKKKRKIPTSGSLSLGQGSLSADLASMGLGRDGADDGPGVGQSYGTGNPALPAGLGVQGAGRGRSGRRVSGRNPLGPSMNGSNARPRYDPVAATATETKAEPGIISAAIANATALLRKPLNKGQENAGVLEQQAKSPTSSSQFTFECNTDAPNVTFPEQSLYASSYAQRANNSAGPDLATHGTQTSPNVPPGSQQPSNQATTTPAGQGKKPRRRRGDVYALAARQRRLQQEYSNLHHTPSPDDIWICEFCEYESIFGRQPTALIRQYEIKDRKERRRLAEKRRLLEKAKLKGRKGKKQTKNAAKAAHTNTNLPKDQQNYANEPLDHMGDEYLDDGYDDDPIPMPAPLPPREAHRPMPGSFNPPATNTSKQGIPPGGGGVR